MAQRSLPYNIGLYPSRNVIGRSVQVSKALKGMGSVFTLDDRNYYPHVTLYVTEFPVKNLPLVIEALRQVVKLAKPLCLESTGYRQSKSGYVDVEYERTRKLRDLQRRVIAALNPLREGLTLKFLRRDFSRLEDWKQRNLTRYGYDNVGARFRPHLTFGKLSDDRVPVIDVLSKLVAGEAFSFEADTLVLFQSGSYAAARRVIRKFKLGK